MYILRDIINQVVFVHSLQYPAVAGTVRHAAITVASWGTCVVIGESISATTSSHPTLAIMSYL